VHEIFKCTINSTNLYVINRPPDWVAIVRFCVTRYNAYRICKAPLYAIGQERWKNVNYQWSNACLKSSFFLYVAVILILPNWTALNGNVFSVTVRWRNCRISLSWPCFRWADGIPNSDDGYIWACCRPEFDCDALLINTHRPIVTSIISLLNCPRVWCRSVFRCAA